MNLSRSHELLVDYLLSIIANYIVHFVSKIADHVRADKSCAQEGLWLIP